MKIAKLFRPFLEIHHYLVLPAIGKFEILSVEINPVSGEIEKNLIRFTEDKRIQPDSELIDYISHQLKVDVCIAESDLQCFCNSAIECLIQGFETEIPGIGFLHIEPGNRLKFSGKSIYKVASKNIKPKQAAFLSSSFWL